MKPILFAQDPPFKGKGFRQSHSRAFLLKYFPKYIRDLKIDLLKGPLNTKLQKMKLIKNLYLEDYKAPESNLWRLIIANKNKTIRYFKCASDGGSRSTFSKKTLQRLKLLPGKQELSFYPPYSLAGPKSHQIVYLERVGSYLGTFNNLRLLELRIQSQRSFPLLAKVSKNERILSHLKIFSLFSEWQSSQEYHFFQELPEYKTFLKHLTSLNLGVLARKEFFQVLQQLPNYCQKLQSLSLSTSQKELTNGNSFPKSFDKNTCLEDENYLECLQDFKTLKKLHISSYHNLAFLRNARLPSALQSLHLDFPLFDWENYENLPDTTPFHHSLKNLTNLKQLELWFSRTSQSEFPSGKCLPATKSLIESLLKTTPRLTRLDIRISSKSYHDGRPLAGWTPFDFSYFLGCISHCSDSLEALEIKDEIGFYKFITESQMTSLQFTKLSSLSLFGDISNLDLESLLRPTSKINLHQIRVKSLKQLLDVFLLVGQFKEIEKKRVQINLDVESLQENSLDEAYFKENYEEVKKKIQGVDLKNVNFKIQSSGTQLKLRKEIESFRPIFGKLDIHTPERSSYP